MDMILDRLTWKNEAWGRCDVMREGGRYDRPSLTRLREGVTVVVTDVVTVLHIMMAV
jgi:hypothetical protein